MYVCKDCGQKFQYKKEYEAHITEHFQERKRIFQKMNVEAMADSEYVVEYVQIEDVENAEQIEDETIE